MKFSGEGARVTIAAIGGIVLCSAWPVAARAQLAVELTATGQYQSNSNIYDLPDGFSYPSPDGYRRSDTLYAYTGAADLTQVLGRQKLFAKLAGTGLRYDHFTDLNHSEYSFEGGWNWVATSLLDGTLDVTRARSMVSFTDVIQSQLALQTDQRENASIALHVLGDWSVEAKGYHRTLDEPLPGSPNLRLTENFGQAGVRYLGRAGVATGVSANYLSGHFDGAGSNINPTYHQTGFALFATVGTDDRPVFNGQVGYSRRSSATGTNSVSGLTGSVDYWRPLSGKTSVILTASRAINSYVTNTGSEIDTLGGITLKYQATFKTGFSLGYTYTHRQLPDQGLGVGTERTDNAQFLSVGMDYEALDWLSIRPYANRQTRSSSLPLAEFSGTIYGVYVSAKWGR